MIAQTSPPAPYARPAYGSQARAIRTARGAEYEAFAMATRQLSAATGPGKGDFAALANALFANQRLWTVIASDVSEPANGLPAELRARLFSLAEFTRQHSSKVLREEADARVLIDINMAVMRGLRGPEADQ